MRTSKDFGGVSRRPRWMPVPFVALALLLAAAPPASANSDPHRTWLGPVGDYEIPADGYCGFLISIVTVADNEYGTVTTLPDGSTLSDGITGSLKQTATNEVTGKTILVNASGPGSLLVSADGTLATWSFRGLTFMWAPNLVSQFGYGSNVAIWSGRGTANLDWNTGEMFTLVGRPHQLLDVCAALS